MTMLSRQNIVNTIFGCMLQKCHTLANWGGCTYVISIKFSGNVILSSYFQKLWQNLGSTGLFRSCNAKCKQQSQLRKIVNTTRRYVLRKKFLNLLLCWIFSFVDTCRYYWEHISRSFCWRRDDKLSLLVIVRKWNINLSLEECLYVVLCKSSGNHQKVMLRTLTLAETKDIHQPRQPGWDAWGFIQKNKCFYLTTSSLSRKISGSGSLNRKPKSSINSALI